MSLFKIREIWCTQSEDDEYFDQNSLLTTKLNNESDFIISGSQSGVLRIFKPSCETNEDKSIGGFSPTDLLIEKIFNFPILQVGCGRLVSGSQNLQLAILHPMLLSIYALRTIEGVTDHGTQNHLELLYEHKLRRSAANFVIGPFGGTQNRDFICVQSLDGMFSFLEQESFTFSCFIPDFLLPGPISYIKKSDSFVTISSSWNIVTYRYKSLSEVGEKSQEKVDETQKVTCDWSYNLGESVIDISVIDDCVNKEAWVMILGERNLYCLNDAGKVKFMKRLDYSPICCNSYIMDDTINSLVISETQTLLIYQNTTLKWSAKLQFLPVCVRRAFLKNIKGALVLLSEEGRLECCYLGTEPSLFVAPPLVMPEIDYEKAEEELAYLNKIIKDSYGNDLKLTNANTEKEMTINVKVSPHLEPCKFEANLTVENLEMCIVAIDILPQIPYEQVQISVLVQRPLKVIPHLQFYNNLSEKTSMSCSVFLGTDFEIPSLEVEITATLISSLGVPRTLSKFVMLPMKLVLETCAAQKESKHKLTLNINHSPVPLGTLFSEYIGENLSQTSNAIGLKNVTGTGRVATILLAKSSERYRLQSDSFASLSLLIEVVIYRLKRHYSDKSDFKITYSSSLPANELTLYVNNHFKRRQHERELQEDLCQLSAQFRTIQKRLIAKFKVKNPTPLTNLEVLLQDTYTEIISVTEKLQQADNDLARAQNELSCALHLTGNLIKLLDVEKSLKEILESTFCSSVNDLDEQGWEDVMDASLCFLLRTVLAKSEKDKLRASDATFREVKDVSKLEKHLMQVMERIPKTPGASDLGAFEEDDEEKERPKSPELVTKPIGSQFGESSSRLLSARKSLLRRRHKAEN